MSGSFHICDIRVQLGGCGIYGYKKKKKKDKFVDSRVGKNKEFS